jgi:hypothetical protein
MWICKCIYFAIQDGGHEPVRSAIITWWEGHQLASLILQCAATVYFNLWFSQRNKIICETKVFQVVIWCWLSFTVF